MDFESIVGLLILAVAWLVRMFAGGARKNQTRPAPGTGTAPETQPQPARADRGSPERTPPEGRRPSQSPGDGGGATWREAEPQEPPPDPARRALEIFRELGLDLEAESARPPAAAPPPPVPPAAPPLPPVPAALPARGSRAKRRSSLRSKPQEPALRVGSPPWRLRERILQDLRGGSPSLARAIVLKEILESPPGLRKPGEPPPR